MATDMAEDDDVRWASWMRRIPPRYRRPVAAALFIGGLVAVRLTGFRDWIQDQPISVVAIPVALLGTWALVLGCGPRRWVERERVKSRGAPFPPGVRVLGKLPIPAMRAFFILFGVGAVTVAVMAWREGR